MTAELVEEQLGAEDSLDSVMAKSQIEVRGFLLGAAVDRYAAIGSTLFIEELAIGNIDQGINEGDEVGTLVA